MVLLNTPHAVAIIVTITWEGAGWLVARCAAVCSEWRDVTGGSKGQNAGHVGDDHEG